MAPQMVPQMEVPHKRLMSSQIRCSVVKLRTSDARMPMEIPLRSRLLF
jgi:hypothetical protein